MTLPAAAETALEQFSSQSSWEQRARLLMHWGNQLQPLSEQERCEVHEVKGCESKVWLIADRTVQGISFRADSEARLLRGLLALLLIRVNGLSSEQLLQVDLHDWFTQLGLARQLTPSRSNGLNAVLQRVRQLAHTKSTLGS